MTQDEFNRKVVELLAETVQRIYPKENDGMQLKSEVEVLSLSLPIGQDD